MEKAKTIKYAVKNFPLPIKKAIIRAFEASNSMDIYDGRLESYITVIAQTMESQNAKVAKLANKVTELKKLLEEEW